MKWLVFSIFLIVGCTPQSKQEISPSGLNHSSESVGIYLVPAWGSESKVMRYLENTLAQQHNVRVQVTTDMGLDRHHFDSEHQQYIAEEIYKSTLEIAKRLRQGQVGQLSPVIVVIPNDMNSEAFRFRYLFSLHFFQEKISVISLARINPTNYGNKPNVNLTSERALKLINKALGYHIYSYKPSSDINNVMYGPIMGVSDLDRVNSWYE